MRTLIAAVLLLCALPAHAQNLRGQWDVTLTDHPAYRGVVLIDAEGRVTFDAPNDNGRPAQFRGVAKATVPRVHITITDRDTVTHLHCIIQSDDLMHCRSFLADGQVSNRMVLVRVGPGPHSLTRRP